MSRINFDLFLTSGIAPFHLGKVAKQVYLSVLFSICLLNGLIQPTVANPFTVNIKHPLVSQQVTQDWLSEARLLASQTINDYFFDHPGDSRVIVTVIGTLDGESLPISVTSVTRDQWQQDPSFNQWTDYNSASNSLLLSRLKQEKNREQKVQPSRSPANQTEYSKTQKEPRVLVQKAFQGGRLSRNEYEGLIDALD